MGQTLSNLTVSNLEAVIVWDDGEMPSSEGAFIVSLNNYSSPNKDIFHLLKYVESKSEKFKGIYLQWVYKLGRFKIDGETLIDSLKFKSGFSYWWMTHISEKCNFDKSPHIDLVIKLIALDDWISDKKIKKIVFVSTNSVLAKCIGQWAKNNGLEIEFKNKGDASSKLNKFEKPYSFLPHILRAIVWLIYYVFDRLPLRGCGKNDWAQSDADCTFVSYLDNLIPGDVLSGDYESRYWGSLIRELKDRGRKTRWLHIYVKDYFLPTAFKASKIIKSLNRGAEGLQVHTTLDSFITNKILFKTIKDWIFILFKSWRVKRAIQKTYCGNFILWPLFEREWKDTMFGKSAIKNILYFNLFGAALRDARGQNLGIFLQENQGWEFALISQWRANHHKKIIGCPHSTIRYWDLRNFFDPQEYFGDSSNSLPRPDLVAVNGPAALKSYISGGYLTNELVEVEALRYLYLKNISMQRVSDEKIVLLVLGDYTKEDTDFLMKILEATYNFLPKNCEVFIKPHPNCPINIDSYSVPGAVLVNGSIEKILLNTTIAFSCSVTSAAIDAYCSGIPLISTINPHALHLSPLRGVENVAFVSNEFEFMQAFTFFENKNFPLNAHVNFFNLDSSLSGWKKIIFS